MRNRGHRRSQDRVGWADVIVAGHICSQTRRFKLMHYCGSGCVGRSRVIGINLALKSDGSLQRDLPPESSQYGTLRGTIFQANTSGWTTLLTFTDSSLSPGPGSRHPLECIWGHGRFFPPILEPGTAWNQVRRAARALSLQQRQRVDPLPGRPAVP